MSTQATNKRVLDTRLITGIEARIYQAKSHTESPGVWHGHVSSTEGFSDDDVKDLPVGRQNDYGTPTNWVDIGSCATELDALRRVTTVIGHIYGRRLFRAMGPIEPLTRTIPAIKTVKL